jgi:hypothetical protein
MTEREEKIWALEEAALLAGYEAEEATSLHYLEEMHRVKKVLLNLAKEIENE